MPEGDEEQKSEPIRKEPPTRPAAVEEDVSTLHLITCLVLVLKTPFIVSWFCNRNKTNTSSNMTKSTLILRVSHEARHSLKPVISKIRSNKKYVCK